MIKKLLLFTAMNFILLAMFAQKPDTIWTNTIGGPGNESGGYSLEDKPKMVYCADGNLLVTGSDTGGFISINHGTIDIFISKINTEGDTLWAKNYGGEDWDYLTDIIPTADGGALFCGYTYSVTNFGVHHDGNDSRDGFIAKIDVNGILEWVKQYGGGDFMGTSGNDFLNKLIDLGSGNYIAVGQTSSNNGDLTVDLTKFSCGWILKIDSQGNKLFSKKIASPDHDEYNGNVIKSGALLTCEKDLMLFGEITYWQAAYKNWLIKIDTNGVEQWQKTKGCLSDNMACEISSLPNNNAVFTGVVYSNDGDVNAYVNENTMYGDIWIVKIDSSGSIINQNVVGGKGYDKAISLKVRENEIYIGGGSNSHQFDLVPDSLGADFFMAKLNQNLDTVWTFKFGGSGSSESISAIAFDSQLNQFYACGNTNSSNGYVHNNHGGSDVWIGKFVDFSVGIDKLTNQIAFDCYPNPASDKINIVLPDYLINANLSIINSLGQIVVLEKNLNKLTTVDLNQLPNGVYFVMVSSLKNSFLKKIIVNGSF